MSFYLITALFLSLPYYNIFFLKCKHTENHRLNSDSGWKIQTHYKIRLISTTALLYVMACWQYKICMVLLRHILCLKPQSLLCCYRVSVPSDVVISECMTLQCWLAALIVCMLFPEWMQTPLNLWGPLYNNWRNVSSIEYCKARWPECLEMCTIFF